MNNPSPRDILRAFWGVKAGESSSRWTEPKLLDWEIELLSDQWDKEGAILDLGSGSGDLSRALAGGNKKLVAVDFEAGFRRHFTSNNHAFVESEVDKYLTRESFSLILLTGVVMYLTHEKESSVYANVRSMLSDGGLVFVKNQVSMGKEKVFHGFSASLSSDYWARYPNIEEQRMLLESFFDGVHVVSYPDFFNKHEDTVHVGFFCRLPRLD
jgi:cyclopropane fatty-acyl-phospholipid synthase-like methyltransferase